MEFLPYELIEYIGSYLSVVDLFNLRLTNSWLFSVLERLYRNRIKFTPWKISAHIVFNKNHEKFNINKVWVSVGEFNSSDDVIYSHEICKDCNGNDYNEIGNHINKIHHIDPQQIYTGVRKGVGGKGISQIVHNIKNNKINITVGWNPSLFNVIGIIIGDNNKDMYYEQIETMQTTIYFGDPQCKSLTNRDEISYGLMGPLYRI